MSDTESTRHDGRARSSVEAVRSPAEPVRKKRGPKSQGSVEWGRRADGTRYARARIRLADGSRERVDVPAKYSVAAGGASADERATLYARYIQEREDKTGELLAAKKQREAAKAKSEAGPSETCDKYFRRHSAARESDGVRDVRKERTIWGKWISPRIGGRPVAEVTRDEIESIRDVLDGQVRQRLKDGLGAGISGATAQNVWTVVRTLFKEAVASRDRTLRMRVDDPTVGHKAPLKTPKREKTFVYPAEFSKLLACEDVPRQWREVYAVAAYTYVRPEELQALTWKDVDFEAGTIHVSKAISARDGKPKPLPKTRNAVRSVPIEPTLRPLLKRMYDGRSADGAAILPVLGELNDKFRAKQFREHLGKAKVIRPRLFEDTATLLQIDFRSCRDSGITWLALARVELARIQRRAGHEDISTTLGYVKMAEDLTGKVGTPFAPLPLDLTSPTGPSSESRSENIGKVVPEEGIEGAMRVVSTRTQVDSRPNESPRVDVSARPMVAFGPSNSSLEDALARAIESAANAARWDIVAQLAKELEARRLAASGAIDLEVERARRKQ
jgi:integrase